MSKQTFCINNCWEVQDILDKLIDMINLAVERPNSDMEDEDFVEITIEFFNGDED